MDQPDERDAVPRLPLRVTAVDWDGREAIGMVSGILPDGREVRAAIGGRTLPIIAAGVASGEVVEIVVEEWQVSAE